VATAALLVAAVVVTLVAPTGVGQVAGFDPDSFATTSVTAASTAASTTVAATQHQRATRQHQRQPQHQHE
jgi:hypothetical protein